MLPTWHQRVPMSGHVGESEAVGLTNRNYTRFSGLTSASTRQLLTRSSFGFQMTCARISLIFSNINTRLSDIKHLKCTVTLCSSRNRMKFRISVSLYIVFYIAMGDIGVFMKIT